ncbi:MAG TPA: DUF5996 family protein [Acidobacteriaceae bacterium]|jgi:hypothetical protein|nr:DUF5996 family protein [Acidobacteriaceae bacterium]
MSDIPKPLPDDPRCWPALPLASWRDTCATLHMWTQIVGKIRLALTPLVNHWWNVPLYVTPRGLTTIKMPRGACSFELRFDFFAHELILETSDGIVESIALRPMAVADFYRECMDLLRSASIQVPIWKTPVEIPDPIPFDQDRVHKSYDAEKVEAFWRVLLSVDTVFHEFRTRFIGKVSPVHFFWGSFDLAVTRFSGRPAPPRPGADAVTREAYSHEVSSVGFWPGSGNLDASFYSYAAPEPPGFRDAAAQPPGAHYDPKPGEFLLAYDAVRVSPSPAAALLAFCQTTYDAAANLAHWDRPTLERDRQP